jgi:hypothetical protein
MYTIQTKMEVSVSGMIKVWIEVHDMEGNLVDKKSLPKSCANGTYLLASERVIEYNAFSAMKQYDPFAVKKRRPVNLSVFGLKEADGQEAAWELEEVGS